MELHYGDFHALKNVNLEIEANKITAFIGPSGCGKSTLLKIHQPDERSGRRHAGSTDRFFWTVRTFSMILM